MTAGSIDVSAISRKGRYATFETGDDCYLPYELEGPFDGDIRDAGLSVASMFGGLAPGVCIARDEELDDELRDMTLSSPSWREWWYAAVEGDPTEKLAERYADELATRAHLDINAAKQRMRELVEVPQPETDAERDTLWSIWKSIRLP